MSILLLFNLAKAATVTPSGAGGVLPASTWAMTPRSGKETPRAQVSPTEPAEEEEEQQPFAPIVSFKINPAPFVQPLPEPIAVLVVDEQGIPLNLVSDDELAAVALLVLQARSNSYRRLCTGIAA